MARETVDTLCQKAQQALAASEHDRARRIYLQALGLRSDAPDVHYGLATVCFLLNDLTSAAYHFKEVTRLDPLRAGAFINLGAVYNRLDQLDDAIPVLRRGIQLDSGRAEGYYNLGLVYRRKGQLDLAIQAYREATKVNPRMADAHYNLGNLYYEKELFPQAVAAYRHALEVRPNWEKAENSMDLAEEALRAATGEQPAAADTSEAASPATPLPFDPDRVLDPVIHGTVLSNLHKATIESENFTRQFVKVVEGEIEPAIKELSSCLLYPDTSSGELDDCVKKFEAAIASMRTVQRGLHTSVERVRSLGEQLFKA